MLFIYLFAETILLQPVNNDLIFSGDNACSDDNDDDDEQCVEDSSTDSLFVARHDAINKHHTT